MRRREGRAQSPQFVSPSEGDAPATGLPQRVGRDDFPTAGRVSSVRGRWPRDHLGGTGCAGFVSSAGVSIPIRHGERLRRVAVRATGGSGGGGWVAVRAPAGIASPRTNVLPRCLPVNRFSNEFSDLPSAVSGAGRLVVAIRGKKSHRTCHGAPIPAPAHETRGGGSCEPVYQTLRVNRSSGLLSVSIWHE